MPVRRRTKALAAVASLATGAAGFALVAAPAGATPPNTQSWSTPGTYSWVVPTDVHTVTVVAEGAQGGDGDYMSPGGAGGRETATISVTPGETLTVVVGGAGTGGAGGLNGGGGVSHGVSMAGGGGGASDVRQGGTGLTDRVVVAGGGGGGGLYRADGGLGGGTDGTANDPHVHGGGAGTASAGGAGGLSDFGDYRPATDGTFGVGGDGGEDMDWGGGGGGGWYGGGGGAGGIDGGGGGGGSNYAVPSATSVLSENGVNSGDGDVTLGWVVTPTTTTTTTTTAPAPTTTTTTPPAPKFTCPSWAIRVDRNTFWAVNLLRWICGYQISKLRNGRKVVTYIVPFGWRWKWTTNPRGRR